MIPECLDVSDIDLETFCQKWDVIQVELFGSALRNDFRPESDVDLLVTYDPECSRTLLDEAQMQVELNELFDRPVHFMTRRAVENSHNDFRREAILESATPIYVESS